MKNLLIHILTTHKNADRQKGILDSWELSGVDYVFYTDNVIPIGNQISTSLDDSYFSCSEKIVNEVARIKQSPIDYYWHLFVDDDTYPNIPGILKFISDKIPNNTCYGKVIDCYTPLPELRYFSGGAGFIVPDSLIRKCHIPSEFLKRITYYSDVAIGLWLRECGAILVSDDRFNVDTPKVLSRDSFSYHYVKSESDREVVRKVFS